MSLIVDKEAKKKDEVSEVVDKVDDRTDEDRRNDEMLRDGIHSIQYIMEKDVKAHEWSKIFNTL